MISSVYGFISLYYFLRVPRWWIYVLQRALAISLWSVLFDNAGCAVLLFTRRYSFIASTRRDTRGRGTLLGSLSGIKPHLGMISEFQKVEQVESDSSVPTRRVHTSRTQTVPFRLCSSGLLLAATTDLLRGQAQVTVTTVSTARQ